jgi:putative AdoMet-dependent methyltransferase
MTIRENANQMNQGPRVKLYDDWAANYDQCIEDGTAPFSFEGYEQVLIENVRAAEIKPGMQILDLGTGTGNLAGRFLEMGCEVVGMDFSEGMLRRAKAKLPALQAVKGNLSARVWPKVADRRFDRVVSAYALHSIDFESKINLIARLWRDHLGLDGRIVIADIAYADEQEMDAARKQWGRLWSEDDNYWDVEKTIAACEQSGISCTYQQVSSCAGVFTMKMLA